MLILKRSLLVLVTTFFTSLLFSTAWTTGLMQTVGTPAPVKKTLSDSGIYDSVLNSFLNQSKKNTGSSGEVSLTDPLVQKAANATFTPSVLKENTEKILDSTYVWLNGGSELPDFNIDLSSYKTTFATNVATSLEASLGALPVCATSTKTKDFDPLTATCIPKGTTPASLATDAKNNLLKGEGFLENPVITANDLKSGKTNTSVFTDSLKNVPDYFAWLKKAPYILGGLTILCGMLIVLLSATRAKGIRRISFTLIFVGLLMLIFAWGANYLITQKALPNIKIDNNRVLQDKVQVLAKDLTQAIVKTYWIFGGAYSALGALGLASPLIVSRLGRGTKHSPQSKKEAPEEKLTDDAPLGEKTHDPEVEKKEEPPKKRTIDVQ